MISANKADKKVVMRIGRKTSVVLAEPNLERSANTLTGMIVKPAVFNARNIICAFEAVSFSGFNSCISFMAFKPSGVAALSSPSMFALKFIIIDPTAG
ncbi:hypothetical protein D3C86_1663580 [compost metagenome]